MFCKNSFLALIQHCISVKGGEIKSIFHILNTELATVILGSHLETVLLVKVFCAAGLKICVKHPVFSFFAATPIFEAMKSTLSSLVSLILSFR